MTFNFQLFCARSLMPLKYTIITIFPIPLQCTELMHKGKQSEHLGDFYEMFTDNGGKRPEVADFLRLQGAKLIWFNQRRVYGSLDLLAYIIRLQRLVKVSVTRN